MSGGFLKKSNMEGENGGLVSDLVGLRVALSKVGGTQVSPLQLLHSLLQAWNVSHLSSHQSHREASSTAGGNTVRISFASISLSTTSDPGVIGKAGATEKTGQGNGASRVRKRAPRRGWRLPFFGDADDKTAETALNHVYAGTMARTCSQVLTHPIDTIKTRMQVKDPPKKLRKWVKKASKKAISVGKLEIDNWFFKGPGDIYRGVTAAIVGTIPNAMMYFIAYESSKRKFENVLPPDLVHIVSASFGTISASIFRVPADTLKHRVQAYMHPNVFDAFQAVVTTEGVAGLYRGFWPTLMRDVPEIAVQFWAYEKMRAFVQKQRGVEKLRTLEHLVLGAAAGAVAATCSMPLDLVKTRQQCGAGAESIQKIVSAVIQEKGWTGLFAGLPPRAVHVSMMSAVFFVGFEYCKLMLKPQRTAADRELGPKIWNKRRDKIWKRQFVYTE
eukprot:TRINITY_DN2590_c0_g10_i1.p1 TRINITY_DN2590_c0_g10~~TRINITY_DN2590_c0_g10_i1.p1  ORF type:complete len:444 (-),score=69.41 TRINITY_DN2590_c0_g10_i1:145-1476(-)